MLLKFTIDTDIDTKGGVFPPPKAPVASWFRYEEIGKPLPHRNVYLANGGYSLKGDSVESSLEMVERAMARYFMAEKPSWLDEDYYKNIVLAEALM
jgi:hypothetical protein